MPATRHPKPASVTPFRLVGLTGGIASGKSTVSARLAAKGLIVIDADMIARQVVSPGTPGLSAVVEAFGPGVLTNDGELDREALAGLVFADPGLRERLNAVVHPLIARRSAELTAAAREAGALAVVYDAPLLVENGLHAAMDLLVVVSAPREVQIERLVERDGISKEDAARRISAQLPLSRKLEVADVVIDNAGDLADTLIQTDALIAGLPRRLWPESSPSLARLLDPPTTGHM